MRPEPFYLLAVIVTLVAFALHSGTVFLVGEVTLFATMLTLDLG